MGPAFILLASILGWIGKEGLVIRHNMGWTLVLLAWLIIVGLLFYFLFPTAMQ